MSPGRAERVDAGRGEREVHAAVDLLVGRRRLVPRAGPAIGRVGVPGDGVGQRVTSAQGRQRDRLDDHDADVALGADREELLGRLAVLGPGPQGGVDREHDRIEVEAAQRLEVGPGHLEVVAGDAGEAGLAGVAEREDLLERGWKAWSAFFHGLPPWTRFSTGFTRIRPTHALNARRHGWN